MDLELGGKVAIITGASRGIGFATADALAAEGCGLAICARGQDDLKTACDQLARHGVDVFGRPCDVGDAPALGRFLDAAHAHFGRADALINNASAMTSGDSDEEYDLAFELDLMSSVRASRQVVPWLSSAGGGAIVHVSSTAALEAPGPPAYSALKAALISHSKNLAVALAPQKIRVNVIAPGAIEFPGGVWEQARNDAPAGYAAMLATIPGGRMGRPEEVAHAIAFLVSPRASWISGAVLSVDGAQHKGNL